MQFLDLAGVKRIKQYVDDSIVNFITNSVSNLTNYYLKSETYTKSEVEALIAAINQFHYEIAASTSAVSSPANNVLYLIGPTGTGEDKYEEYVYSNSNWVKIGDTSISLSGYVTTQMLNTALADYTNTTTLNTLLAGKQDVINDLSDIRTGSQNNVKYTSQSLTDTQKTQARTNIGAGTYSKPSSGIPASDLADDVIPYVENFYFVNGTSSQAGNSTSGSYLSTKWEGVVPGVSSAVDGLKLAYRINTNTGVGTAGAVLSIDGTNYYPVVLNTNTKITTHYPVGSTILLVFNSAQTVASVYLTSNTATTVTGCWQIADYNTNTDTIGYSIRTNSSTLPAKFKTYRYRLLFTSADGNYWVGANASTSTNATAVRTPTTEKINPFGPIVYYGTTTAINANTNFGAGYLWQQYSITLGYSFNNTGTDLTLTYPAPVYLKCTPQNDGSAIIDATTPYVQELPTTEDGKIYIFLGIAYAETTMELRIEHPVYYYKDGAIRLWSNQSTSYTETDPIFSASVAASITSSDIINWNSKTSNTGTVTQVKVGNTAYDPSSGVVSLPAYPTTLPASDVSSWAKAANKPTYTAAEVGALPDTTTIPAAPGTLITNATTAQTASSGEAMSGSITLHKVAKTGTYSDLIGKPTIPAAQVQSDWNATSGMGVILNKPTIPAAVTESTVSGWGFTKNTGTYSKPSGGIPKTDLASAVQTSLGKADTALQSFTETDPVFSASAAAGITASDITNWNGKTSNTGTVTGVKINGTTKNPTSGVVDLGTVLTSYTETDPTVPSWAKAATKPSYTASEVGALPDTTVIPTVPTISTNVVSDKASDVKTSSPKSVYSEIHPTVVTTQPSGGFVPNIFYRLGTITGSATFSLVTPTDNTIENEYHWSFTAGNPAPTITWPSGIEWVGGESPTINAGQKYEISILDNIAGNILEPVSSGGGSSYTLPIASESGLGGIKVGSGLSIDSTTGVLSTSGGSGDVNVIEAITFNGNPATITNKTAAITATIPTKVSDLTNDSGFTSNTGTITGITMNGSSKGTSGVVNLGTVLTAHQDISGKANLSGAAFTGAVTGTSSGNTGQFRNITISSSEPTSSSGSNGDIWIVI